MSEHEHQESFDVNAHNRRAWDAQVEQRNRWTVPVSADQIAQARRGDLRILLTPCKPVPKAWLPTLRGKRVLCLAGAGGQQAPLLAAAGADVSVLDNSPKQLEQDQLVAHREGLAIRSVLGLMTDLSAFEDESFDLIVHPCSNNFSPVIVPVWHEAHRVLRQGGHLLAGFCNPIIYAFDYERWEQGELVVRYPIPMSEADSYDESLKRKMVARNEPFSFAHTLQDQIGGQIAAGFAITGFYDDNWASSENAPLAKYIDCFIATRATKC